jgi:hypothetical protein
MVALSIPHRRFASFVPMPPIISVMLSSQTQEQSVFLDSPMVFRQSLHIGMGARLPSD